MGQEIPNQLGACRCANAPVVRQPIAAGRPHSCKDALSWTGSNDAVARTTTSAGRTRELRSDAARNREELLRAATVTLHREGAGVPMSAIAAEAGVGIGTLYRHFPDRENLLGELTHRSFEQVLLNAVSAEARGSSPINSLKQFIESAIKQREQLVLPLNGGPAIGLSATRRTRQQVHETIGRIIDQGKADGSIRSDIEPFDIIMFGSMLSQPKPRTAHWDAACHRLLDNFLRGLGS